MNQSVKIVELTDPQEKSNACDAIIWSLPDWFGISESNRHYIGGIADKDTFAVLDEDRIVGLIALKYHLRKTAEIWWMGLLHEYHGRGAGYAMLDVARKRAHATGCERMAVTTLSPRSDDEFYARTRAFYKKAGFEAFVEYNETDPQNPMIWMILPLQKRDI